MPTTKTESEELRAGVQLHTTTFENGFSEATKWIYELENKRRAWAMGRRHTSAQRGLHRWPSCCRCRSRSWFPPHPLLRLRRGPLRWRWKRASVPPAGPQRAARRCPAAQQPARRQGIRKCGPRGLAQYWPVKLLRHTLRYRRLAVPAQRQVAQPERMQARTVAGVVDEVRRDRVVGKEQRGEKVRHAKHVE